MATRLAPVLPPATVLPPALPPALPTDVPCTTTISWPAPPGRSAAGVPAISEFGLGILVFAVARDEGAGRRGDVRVRVALLGVALHSSTKVAIGQWTISIAKSPKCLFTLDLLHGIGWWECSPIAANAFHKLCKMMGARIFFDREYTTHMSIAGCSHAATLMMLVTRRALDRVFAIAPTVRGCPLTSSLFAFPLHSTRSNQPRWRL
mgnify:CR=1 FL=1